MKAVKEAFGCEAFSIPTDVQTMVIKNLDERLARLEGILSAGAEKTATCHRENEPGSDRSRREREG